MTATVEHFEQVDRATGADLLGTERFGRLALSVGALPTVVPVRYELDPRGDLLVVLRADSRTLGSVLGAVVAFQVDHLAARGPSWSVVVRGVAESVPADEAAAVLARIHPGGAPPGARVVRVHAAVVDGSRWEAAS